MGLGTPAHTGTQSGLQGSPGERLKRMGAHPELQGWEHRRTQ